MKIELFWALGRFQSKNWVIGRKGFGPYSGQILGLRTISGLGHFPLYRQNCKSHLNFLRKLIQTPEKRRLNDFN